jgi:hypothetical protein
MPAEGDELGEAIESFAFIHGGPDCFPKSEVVNIFKREGCSAIALSRTFLTPFTARRR